MDKGKKQHKIALYIRVSTEEQAANPEGSIKNQEERLRTVVKLKNLEGAFGEIKHVYTDTKSGKNTKRSELQKLLLAIRKREIDLVMVTELSRISRSVKDFSDIWNLMQENQCGFCSLRENFDTTTAAGEMVLLIVASLAQFERRQISERVAANFNARSQRGLFNGGAIPFGYKKHSERSGRLEVDEESAAIVRKAYAAFTREGALMPAARWLNENQIRMKKDREGNGAKKRLGIFTVDNLQAMIRNKMYMGIKVYKQQGEQKETEAAWPAIIDPETFAIANGILSKKKKLVCCDSDGNDSRYPYLLSTLVFCKKCRARLPGKSAHGRSGKVGYYEHAWLTKKGSHVPGLKHECFPHRVPAKQIEPLVWEQIKRVLSSDKIILDILDSAKKAYLLNPGSRDADRCRQTILSVEEKLETLSERLSTLPKSISAVPIYNQMEKLEDVKRDAERSLKGHESNGSATGTPIELKEYDLFRKKLFDFLNNNPKPETKAKIARYLIQSVGVHENGIDINWAVGEGYIKCILGQWQDGWRKNQVLGCNKNPSFDVKKNNATGTEMGVGGSNTLTNGRRGGI